MTWLYLLCFGLLVGAELNAVLLARRARAGRAAGAAAPAPPPGAGERAGATGGRAAAAPLPDGDRSRGRALRLLDAEPLQHAAGARPTRRPGRGSPS